jgi:hypothetical protein
VRVALPDMPVIIYDLQGRILYSSDIQLQRNQAAIEINLENISKGVYLLKAGSYTEKIIKL